MSPNSSQTAVGKTYETLKGTVLQGDAEWFQQAVSSSNGSWWLLLIIGILLFVLIAGVVETGTFFGIVFPSNLIVSWAVIAFVMMKNRWMVTTVVILSILATIIGDHIGYYTGKKLGSWLYEKEDTRYFKKKYFIKAQEALTKRGKKIIYVGRFMSFGFLLPTIFGMMNRDKKDFLQLSVLSAALWKLSITLPLIIVLVLFPSLKIGILLILCMVVPEITWWIILLKPEAEKYYERLWNAKEQIEAIRSNFSSIKGNIGDILTKLKTPTEAQAFAQSLEQPLQDIKSDNTTSNNIILNNTMTNPEQISNISLKNNDHETTLEKVNNITNNLKETATRRGWQAKNVWWLRAWKVKNIASTLPNPFKLFKKAKEV